MMGKLNVSIVLYHTPIQEVTKMVYCLRMHSDVGQIFLIDNSEHQTAAFQALDATYCFMNKNLGYGSGHNIAMRTSIKEKIPYHLVLNSDMSFNSEILSELLAHMDSHPLVGQMMPKVFYPNGEIQYLCKLLPSPMDLFGRRFLPKRWTEQRNHRFELRHSGYTSIINAPYLSGCFMLLRTEALEKVGLFDERFFMYPEDMDLTRRIHTHYQTLFYPQVEIVHCHQQGSYRNFKLLWIHATNMIRYFNKWGWFNDSERSCFNTQTLSDIDTTLLNNSK